VGYPRPANLAYIRIAPSVQGRSREASLGERDEVRRLRAHVRNTSSRAVPELPPGPLGVPARNWLTFRQAIRGDAGGEKQGP